MMTDQTVAEHSASPERGVGTVLILDGEREQSLVLRSAMERAGFSVREFETLEELCQHWDWAQPSCLMTDLRKFGGNGDLHQRLATEAGPFPIIVLSGHHILDAKLAIENSSFHWLARPPQESEMVAAVRLALDQDRHHFKRIARVEENCQRLNCLTQPEREVLDLMMKGKSNKAMAFELDIGLRTVELRRQSVFQKLHANSLAELVLIVAEIRSSDISNKLESRCL